ncbi:imidazole glycerol phosphate synthase subunit HisH [Pusillimonas sp. ANT_WB101]|uniref:imidazole glycerol phosphate synthase subunit HisH n=1 Tax=Pusillimonas sp. ANT_WB101 TaxID=2597356 RepID=UPI0011EE46A6|nr:imidazole glycerol phosphate synthase subunit HisH [Pusillimonas sp. ANT_WB101]KAA0889516.1 imidazole glycerol phosphate synthase subunit HisH [Pusillimonas sp. ANT_WB101]
MIGVLDYGCGNINSVIRMIEKNGGQARKVGTAAQLSEIDKLIIPGVGAFDHGMHELKDRDLLKPLDVFAHQRKKPVLGICLGMQLMCLDSEEGEQQGLGWISAHVRRFDTRKTPELKVPHMGWADLKVIRANHLLPLGEAKVRFYFVHAYKVEATCTSDVIATATHGEDFVAAFERDNVMGVQFHPEKSHRFGFMLLKNFMDIPA